MQPWFVFLFFGGGFVMLRLDHGTRYCYCTSHPVYRCWFGDGLSSGWWHFECTFFLCILSFVDLGRFFVWMFDHKKRKPSSLFHYIYKIHSAYGIKELRDIKRLPRFSFIHFHLIYQPSLGFYMPQMFMAFAINPEILTCTALSATECFSLT